MAFLWNTSLETGHPLIDEQHKLFLTAINELHEACLQPKNIQTLKRALAFLAYYTSKHFFDEEGLQILYGYPDYAFHRRLHDECRKNVRDLDTELRTVEMFAGQSLAESSPLAHFAAKVRVSIGEWLLKHIINQDFKLAGYIREHTERA